MSSRTTLTVTMVFGLTLIGGATAAHAGDLAKGEDISRVRAVDPGQQMVVLNDGLHLTVTDPAVLAAVHEGEIVQVSYTQEGDRLVANKIQEVEREPSPYDQMKLGEGESAGPKAIITAPGAASDSYGAGTQPRESGEEAP